ncbi:sulfatase [Tundrisphaera sp. TA3]|uniref:sulfatase n=1 Tax=Tundrisphaera sp. TA3 TaxID=3435775 RepID=UPI003EB87523
MADRTEAPGAGAAAAVVVMAVGFGLVAGLLELAVLVVQDAIDPRVTVDSIRTNHHYPWMIPVSTLALFSTAGVVLGLVAWLRPRPVARVAPVLLGVPMFLGPLLAVRGLYPIVCVLLAVGLAVRMASWVRVDSPRFRRIAGPAIPVLLGLVGVLGWIRARELSADTPRTAATTAGTAAAARKIGPNVLLIVMDTVRADHLSLHGYRRATTPNLDRWAKRGAVFTGARSTAPWTLPSHASMLTGRWPHELSADVDHPLNDEYPTLAEALSARGYATGGFVANTYYCNAWYGLDRGFERYEDFPENLQVTPVEILRASTLGRKVAHKAGFDDEKPGEKGSRKSAAAINRAAMDWISGLGGRPFFAFLNYYDAHGPFEPPDNHARRFGPGATDPAARLSTFRQLHDRHAQDAPGGGDGDASGAPAAPRTPAGGVAPVELLVDSYDECIASIDAELGAMLDELDRRGVLADTLVIITSDHGEHFGDRGLFGHGHSLYAPLIDVPLMILPPRSHLVEESGPAGLRVSEPVSLRDLPATVAEVVGLGPASPFPGRSLVRCWQPEAAPAKPGEPPLSEVEHQKKFADNPRVPAATGPLWSLVEGTLVYIRDSRGGEQLYDRSIDPAETRNLADLPDRRADLERLRQALGQLVPDAEEGDGEG